jgi:sigma54-dependent transcription regulator
LLSLTRNFKLGTQNWALPFLYRQRVVSTAKPSRKPQFRHHFSLKFIQHFQLTQTEEIAKKTASVTQHPLAHFHSKPATKNSKLAIIAEEITIEDFLKGRAGWPQPADAEAATIRLPIAS